MNQDLKIIKKKYGEKMMHLCRSLFPTILEKHPGVLSKIITMMFAPNRKLYDDIERFNYEAEFRNFIYGIYENLKCVKDERKGYVADPITLLKQAGYTLYECKTEEDIQKFKKYYAKGEELCTFKENRLNKCYVYFAVKDGADKLKRSDFTNPCRQDVYGTSVISIQFTRDKSHTLSIKNRYNHTVSNPDATFSNNLDNIIMGLSQSFANYYGLKQRYAKITDFDMHGYVRANDGKYYKYNYERDNVYYCPGNIVIDNFKVYEYPCEKYLVADYFIVDLVNKKIINKTCDSFTATIPEIKKINVVNEESYKKVTITPVTGEDIIITLDDDGKIVGYKNNNVVEINDNFLLYNTVLEEIELNQARRIGNNFLMNNHIMMKISLPNVAVISGNFMPHSNIQEVDLPSAMIVEKYFLGYNFTLKHLELPNVIKIGRFCLTSNNKLETIILPKVEVIEHNSFMCVKMLVHFYAPKVKSLPYGFGNIKILNRNNINGVNNYLSNKGKRKNLENN